VSASARDRAWLLTHLRDQVSHLAALIDSGGAGAGDELDLIALRDQIFVIRETLDSLAVPHALSSNGDWNIAIGTTRS
jgi:hypothetical protein